VDALLVKRAQKGLGIDNVIRSSCFQIISKVIAEINRHALLLIGKHGYKGTNSV